MTDRFVTVPDSLELPAAVKVPSARLSDSGATGRAALAAADAAALRAAAELGSAATTAATDYATAAQVADLASLSSTYAAYDVTPPGTADDKARIIAAATAAAAAGRDVLRIAPGTYVATGLTVADISSLYVVGDGVTLTGAWVYPFTTAELAGLSATATAARGGNGAVAFEVDDSLPEHWTDLFPLSKELGITFGDAWITGISAPWVTEAARHGWEFMWHGVDTTNLTAYTEAQLEAAIETGLTTMEAALGTRKDLGMVYPQHARSYETDRILSKYFTRGRGIADTTIYPTSPGQPWLTAAWATDPSLAGGVVSAALKERLRNVARTDGRAVLYIHFNNATKATQSAGLRELIPFIRSLGIQIVNPSQVWGPRNIAADPYDTESSRWTPSGHATRTTDAAYHGDHSFVVTTPAAASGTGTVWSAVPYSVSPCPGRFSVWRASFRYRADSEITTTGVLQGIRFLAGATLRTVDGASTTTLPGTGATPFLPAFPGTTIPAAQWVRVGELIYLEPATVAVSVAVSVQNLAAGSVPLYLDEFKVERLDEVSSVTYTATLNGVANVYVSTGVPNLSRQTIHITPKAAIAGRVSYTLNANLIALKSSDAADKAQVSITILPGSSYADATLPATGA